MMITLLGYSQPYKYWKPDPNIMYDKEELNGKYDDIKLFQ